MIVQKGHLVGGPRPLGHIVQGAVVIPQNQAPVAYTDSAQTAYQTPVDIDLLSNDIDLDGTLDASSVEVVTQPTNGTVSINPLNGIATYTPGLEFYGVDTFEYRVADDQGAWSEPVAVSLDVAFISRHFSYLSESGGMYYQLSNSQSFSVFEWEFKFVPESDDDFHQLISGDDFTLNLQAADKLTLIVPGYFTVVTTSAVVRDSVNVVSIKQAVDFLSITLNGMEEIFNVTTIPLTISRFCTATAYGTSSPLSGIFFDFKAWDGGDRANGALVMDIPFDEDTRVNGYAPDAFLEFSATDEWDASNVVVGVESSWDESTGVAHLVSDGSYASIRSGDVELDAWYRIQFEVFDLVTGSVVIKIGTDPYGKVFEREGTFDILVYAATDAPTTMVEFKRAAIGSANNLKLRNIRVNKVVSGSIVDHINIPYDTSLVYTLEPTWGWLGPDLITDSNWSDPSSLNSGQWSYENGNWRLVGDGSLAAVQPLASYEQPRIHLVRGEVLEVSGGSGLSLTSGSSTPAVSSAREYAQIVKVADDGTQQFKRRGGVVNALVARPTLQKLLEIVDVEYV
jgi:hypothetical protein